MFGRCAALVVETEGLHDTHQGLDWCRMLEKVLVANSGETAVRLIRACKDLNIRTVAVYSQADANSMHVQLADGAICIGEGANDYLRLDRLIRAAKITGVDAILLPPIGLQ